VPKPKENLAAPASDGATWLKVCDDIGGEMLPDSAAKAAVENNMAIEAKQSFTVKSFLFFLG
jgi:hypothetical protein